MDKRFNDLERELKSLRRGVGMDPAKMAECPTICLALGAAREPVRAITLLGALISLIGLNRDMRALQNAYAMGRKEADQLEQRRDDYCKRNNRVSTRNLQNWENTAIQNLAHVLLSRLVDKPDGIKVLQYIGGTEVYYISVRQQYQNGREDRTLKVANGTDAGSSFCFPATVGMIDATLEIVIEFSAEEGFDIPARWKQGSSESPEVTAEEEAATEYRVLDGKPWMRFTQPGSGTTISATWQRTIPGYFYKVWWEYD